MVPAAFICRQILYLQAVVLLATGLSMVKRRHGTERTDGTDDVENAGKERGRARGGVVNNFFEKSLGVCPYLPHPLC